MWESEAAVQSSVLHLRAAEVILVCSWAGVYLLQLNYTPALSWPPGAVSDLDSLVGLEEDTAMA